ncbi:MAG TPA: tetratricopeptide repeat protein [Saprospiraceae bacterium]|nr:tetratricopeptide repeat protein [Saprospiraceae bacterium]
MIFRLTVLLSIISLSLALNAQIKDCTVADSLMMQQEYFKAIEWYHDCYKADTTDKRPYLALANTYYLLGDYQNAKIYYHTLENHEVYQADALVRLASIYESQQNLPKAIKYNIALSKRFPSNPIYYRKLGSLYLLGNEQKQSIESYQKALQLNERDVLTIQGISELFLSLDSLDMADSLLTKGLQIDSSHIGLSLLKSRVKYRQRSYNEVANILFKLTFVTELNNYYNKLLGYSFMQIDSLEKAIFHLQKSLLNEGDPEYALFYLALAYEKKKDYDRADYYYGEAIKEGISENMTHYHRGLARTHTIRGNYGEALKQYGKSQAYERDADVYYYMGNAAEQYYKDKSKAIKYYQQYLDSNPENDTWVKNAKDRIKVLKELRFMRGKNK